MTAQEVFDISSKHLLTQMKRSYGSVHIIDDDGIEVNWQTCLYRGPDGYKCAIGPLIPDADYNPNFEGLDCSDKPPNKRLKAKKLFNDLLIKLGLIDHLELLESLQLVHDGYSTDFWHEELKAVANRFGLVMA